MYLFAYASLLLALLFALGGAGAGVAQLWQDETRTSAGWKKPIWASPSA